MSRRCNSDILQLQTIVPAAALGLGSKTSPEKRAVQPVAGTVAREHPAGTISSVCRRCKSHDQHARIGVAKRRDRFAPVVPFKVRPAFGPGDFAAIGDQPGTFLACDDSLLQDVQLGVTALVATIHSMKTPFRLDGRIALVTGGASGIGEQTCRALAQSGAAVIIADIDEDRAKSLSSELPDSSVMKLDVTDEEAVKAAAAALQRLDILVNNAGLGLVGGVTETQLADFRRLFRVNVEGVFLMTKHFLPLLLAAYDPPRIGVIVNIGSVSGLTGVKRRFAYCGTKGAVIALTRQLAVDFPRELRVNCIAPGTVETPFVEAYLEKNHKHEKDRARAELHARQPLGRMGLPEEVAWLAVYMCSDEAAFMNGSIVPIDGGWTAG
jgi:2-keto-3-deoxy-L-fuconate dehydrogenase